MLPKKYPNEIPIVDVTCHLGCDGDKCEQECDGNCDNCQCEQEDGEDEKVGFIWVCPYDEPDPEND